MNLSTPWAVAIYMLMLGWTFNLLAGLASYYVGSIGKAINISD